MANNRMWLKNRRTGQEVLLAKYYPTTGWHAFDLPMSCLVERMNAMFDADDSPMTPRGTEDWYIGYEGSAPGILEAVAECVHGA